MAKKIPVVAVVVPTTGEFPQITDAIRNAGKALKSKGVKPLFIVSSNKKLSGERIKAIQGLGEEVNFLVIENGRIGNQMIAGFDFAVNKSDVITMLPDDFVFEAQGIYSTVKPVLNGRYEFVNSCWHYKDSRFAKSFPEPQYLNEVTVSRLVTLANPAFHPRDLRLMPALRQAEKEGKLFQTYTGLLSLKSSEWSKVKQAMQTVLQGKEEEINVWAFEIALMLSAFHARKKVGAVPAKRLFEHEWPSEQSIQALRDKRLLQFRVATEVIKTFLERTNQAHKIPLLEEIVRQTIRRIQKASHHTKEEVWKRLERMRKQKKFRKQFPKIRKKLR